MKKNKKIYIVLVVLVVILITIAIWKNVDVKDNNSVSNTEIEEVVPEEEISDEQNRMTIITLYFVDFDTGEMVHEAKSVDAKELIDNPYEKVIEYLIEGAQNENLGSSIPEGTVLNSASLEGDKLILDFNENFIVNKDNSPEEFEKICESISNTCLEFNDVSEVVFEVNGEKVDS